MDYEQSMTRFRDRLSVMPTRVMFLDAHHACEDHPDTKLDYLVATALANMVGWSSGKARGKMLQNITIPFTETGSEDTHIFPVIVLQGLR